MSSTPLDFNERPLPVRSTFSWPTPPRFAVVDVETTGISYNSHHRVIEIGVVLLDSDLRVEHRWETLLNPDRDLGPSHKHGIMARDVLDAPVFADVADEFASLLEGRLLVAHNAPFEAGFLAAEFGRLGVAAELAPSALCTMHLAPRALQAAGRTLEACCSAAGIVNDHPHAALADATATALLFTELSRHQSVRGEVYSRVPLPRFRLPYPPGSSPRPLKPRTTAPPAPEPSSWISRIAATMPRIPVGIADEAYLAVLDRALSDGILDGQEQAELVAVADALSLDRSIVMELHERYLDAMTKLALADGIITAEERAELDAAATQVGLVQIGSVPPSQAHPTSAAPPDLRLRPGDRVTFTGDMVVARSEWERRARDKGLDVGGVTKKSAVLVAADPDSLSGKAKKAREYDVLIVGEDVFALLLGAMD